MVDQRLADAAAAYTAAHNDLINTAVSAGVIERNNSLALAAGAQPGDSVTINGVKHTVTSEAAAPTPPKKPKNLRLDDHPEPGDGYLVQMVTDALGNFFGHSLDRNAIMHTKGTVTADGHYNSRIVDANGNENRATDGGVKTKAANKTSTVAGHSDSGVGGGESSNVGKGINKQNSGPETKATDGTKAETTAQSAKTFAQGGNGPQRIKGDYSLSSEEGGLHFEAAKEITMTAKGKNIGLSTKTGTITLTAGDNSIVISPRGINIVANTGPVIVYSRHLDVHVAADKYISLNSYNADVTVTTPAGKIDLNP